MKIIDITTRKQLDTYMNPQRQRLLKCLELNITPMTPKQISDVLNISPSSATFHLKKLVELGVVELDHTEIIHGILARFYKKVPVTINLGAGIEGDLKAEKEVLADYFINDTWNGFKKYMNGLQLNEESEIDDVLGDSKNGILYLTDEEAKELKTIINQFMADHSIPKENTKPWEVAVIAYPRKDVD
jgi:DNA-binding transcriptional ArsR family regulator